MTDDSKKKGKWPSQPTPPKGAPNVLVVMTDDVGFGACSTFGGPVPTPTLDKIASNGLRYTQFHTTAMCSPTRASLLTGRNPHNVNMGRIATFPSGVDGYTSVIPDNAGTVATVLSRTGYSTAMFGKSHLTPEWEISSAGPFDRWPTGLGFGYFWGFLSHDTNQWAPNLVENTRYIDPPRTNPPRHFDELLADRTIAWIREQRSTTPDRPFFAYYATGTAHVPHHAPKEWIAKFKGAFDHGWDETRIRTFNKQLELGIAPPDAKLTPRHEDIPAWDTLSSDQKRVAARLMESFAAALSHCDHQFGRVIEELEQLGELDNTLIIFIQGDNGGTAEGGMAGRLVSYSRQQMLEEDLKYVLEHIDDIGSPNAYNNYPAGWGWAMNTPFQYYKQVASHFGGTRNGVVISWPKRIKKTGEIRTQFHHVSDIMPTILEAVGVKAPDDIDGLKQMPLDGTSMAYTFDDAAAPSHKTTQIFELKENFALYKDGWIASSIPVAKPWLFATFQPPQPPAEQRSWELYNTTKDFSQANDLAKAEPQKLAELQKEFWRLAEINHILPIHGMNYGSEGKPVVGGHRHKYTFHGSLEMRVAEPAAPHFPGHSFKLSADVDILNANEHGVLLTYGSKFCGFAFFVKDGKLSFYYNAVAPRVYRVEDQNALKPGRHLLEALVRLDKAELGSPATVRLLVDGKVVAEGRIEHTAKSYINTGELHIGRDSLTAVCGDYTIENSRFTGKIRQVDILMDADS